MWVGRSGYDYAAEVSCSAEFDAVARRISEFYRSQNAQILEESVGTLTLGRGKKAVFWQTISETTQPQTIYIRLRADGQRTIASIRYHVGSRYAIKFAPCMLSREVAVLRRILEVEYAA